MRVVISQSMLFPWVGLLEQVRLADVFVHYDDVQFSKGSFVNRVQIKTPEGMRWMTIPLDTLRLGQHIDEVRIATDRDWQDQHLSLLERSFKGTPYAADALQMAAEVYATEHPHLGALARASMMVLCRYFGLDLDTRFIDVKDLGIPGNSTERVLSVVRKLSGEVYITGHGAARYLDHTAFEQQGIRVAYMDYQPRPYPQSHGEFTPYVSGLDLVAHCGKAGAAFIAGSTLPWREFMATNAKFQ